MGYLQIFKAGYLCSQKYCHDLLTNPLIMTLLYLARLVSSVATGVSLVNIRLLPSSTSDFYVTVSNNLNASFINT